MSFRVWPWDAEWKVISHAALLCLLDMARQDHFQRCGFLRLMFKSGWFVPVAAVHVSFKKPIFRFERISVSTLVSYWNDRDILIEHEVFRGQELVATSLVRGRIKKGRDTVNPHTVVQALGGGRVNPGASSRLTKLLELEADASEQV